MHDPVYHFADRAVTPGGDDVSSLLLRGFLRQLTSVARMLRFDPFDARNALKVVEASCYGIAAAAGRLTTARAWIDDDHCFHRMSGVHAEQRQEVTVIAWRSV